MNVFYQPLELHLVLLVVSKMLRRCLKLVHLPVCILARRLACVQEDLGCNGHIVNVLLASCFVKFA